jgi:hypothetical protein
MRRCSHGCEEGSMLRAISLFLLILWMLGVATSFTLGGFVHILLIAAVVILLTRIIEGRREAAHREVIGPREVYGGADETRTRDLRRDRLKEKVLIRLKVNGLGETVGFVLNVVFIGIFRYYLV